MIRQWRKRRHLSQLRLAQAADVSPRHLSFVENGRANASRDLLLRLAETLALSHRECNALLVAGGYAPPYPERRFDEASFRVVRETIGLVLRAHEPYPALAIDRHWNLIAANRTASLLLGQSGNVTSPQTVNVVRLSVHPEGLGGRIVNARQFSASLANRLRHEADRSGDAVLASLLDEVEAWRRAQGWPRGDETMVDPALAQEVAVPLRIDTELGMLSFLGTTMVFGTATDITVSELTIESFFPLDTATHEALAGLSRSLSSGTQAGR